MAMAPITARITLPERAARGEIVPVRILVRHPMERGVDAAGVAPIPRRILHSFRATYAGAEVFSMSLSPGIAANPYVEFTTVAVETGEMVFEWIEDGGATFRRTARLIVT